MASCDAVRVASQHTSFKHTSLVLSHLATTQTTTLFLSTHYIAPRLGPTHSPLCIQSIYTLKQSACVFIIDLLCIDIITTKGGIIIYINFKSRNLVNITLFHHRARRTLVQITRTNCSRIAA